ncbi:MAG: hypothetical protein HRU17_17755 [Polyangiaceae bacterium]|nr:hypothetical protein [Polyangiaceae bacterium]
MMNATQPWVAVPVFATAALCCTHGGGSDGSSTDRLRDGFARFVRAASH